MTKPKHKKNSDSKTKVYQPRKSMGKDHAKKGRVYQSRTITELPSTKPTDNDENTDSKTKADLRLHGGRERFTIRCKPEIKEQLLRFCKRV